MADITYREPPIPIGRHLDGRYAVALSVFKESTANTVETARQVTALIENEIVADPTLEGINLFVFNDQAAEITSGLSGLMTEGLLGGALAMVVLFLFLRRIDTTIIVGLAIPMSIIATAVGLFVLDKSLNVLVMMGLMLGVGLLVDDAIVVLESIFREHSNAGDADLVDASRAAITGARKVWGAVFASTVTTAIVFLPMIVGSRNQLTVFLEEIGWAITLCIFSSLVVSMTLIPLMASRLLSGERCGAAPLDRPALRPICPASQVDVPPSLGDVRDYRRHFCEHCIAVLARPPDGDVRRCQPKADTARLRVHRLPLQGRGGVSGE